MQYFSPQIVKPQINNLNVHAMTECSKAALKSRHTFHSTSIRSRFLFIYFLVFDILPFISFISFHKGC